MRTTVDIKPEHRDALLEVAARRGEKSFSRVLAEAIEEYPTRKGRGCGGGRNWLSLAGSVSAEEARSLPQNGRFFAGELALIVAHDSLSDWCKGEVRGRSSLESHRPLRVHHFPIALNNPANRESFSPARSSRV